MKERFEVYHGIQITDNAIVSAATLSDRYIGDRFLPDKAIDIIDECSAMIRTEIDSVPENLDQMRRQLMRLEIEEAALKKEKDSQSKQRLEELHRELVDLRGQVESTEAIYKKEKAAIHEVQKIQKEIEEINQKIKEAERTYDLETVARLRHGQRPQLEAKLNELKQQDQEAFTLLREQVTDHEVAQVISRWSGIPLEKLMEGEREKLLNLESTLHQRVVGQDEAVTQISDAIMRSRAHIHDPEKTHWLFLILRSNRCR